MGWASPSLPGPAVQLERVLDAYDRLWHRCRAHRPDLTDRLPSPHELRTGETPDDVTNRLLEEHQPCDLPDCRICEAMAR